MSRMIRKSRKSLFLATAFVAVLGSALFSAFGDAPPAAPAQAAPSAVEGSAPFEVFPQDINLETARDHQSVVVRVTQPDGVTRDVTGEAKFEMADGKVAKVEGNVLRPQADGATQLTVKYEGHAATIPVAVKDAHSSPPVSFKLDVMPTFLKAGCNTGGCHGSARGKDGFMMSLFGYDPEGDYLRITRQQTNRRVNLALPEESLLLTKSTGKVPHTGGERFKPDSDLYKTMLTWIKDGVPQDAETVAQPMSMELLPKNAVLEGEGSQQQLVVRVRYSDGTDRDMTKLAVFLSSNDNSATVDPAGKVTAAKHGEAFVMARFATFTIGSQVIVVPKSEKYEFPSYATENSYVDRLINDKLKRLRITPSDLCSDEVFIRRAYLDVIGLTPTPEQLTAFVEDKEPKKREKLIDALLARPEFVDMWVMKFAELLKIRSSQENQVSYKAALQYFTWLQDQLSKNVPMDQVVQQLLSSTGGTFDNPATNYYLVERDKTKLAENTAQAFMGMRIQCAQCHNHPFDRWTQNDYYGFVSFFSQVGRKSGEDPRESIIFNAGGGETPHPITSKPLPPKFLGGEVPDVKGKDRREVLAKWLASKDNPYFARNLSNIVWAHFMGTGIVDPVDDVRISNPPVNPELLDALAQNFTDYNYDFKRLVRDICTSRTYQLSTQATPSNASDTRNFARGPIRRIRAEVLLDVISQVTETKEKFKGLPLGSRAVQIADGDVSSYFLTTFGRAKRETVCSCEVSMAPNLSQALHLLNGQTTQGRVEQGGVVNRMLIVEKRPAEEVIEQLYLRCLSRKPTAEELTKLKGMLPEDPTEKRKLIEDVFWALLNSDEFLFNH